MHCFAVTSSVLLVEIFSFLSFGHLFSVMLITLWFVCSSGTVTSLDIGLSNWSLEYITVSL
jgi:hypothetical protein